MVFKQATIIKSALGIGVIGGLSGGGYAISQLFSKNEIADKLTKNGYTILTNTPENSQHWTAILTNYKTIVETQPKLKFGTFTGKETTPKPEEELARLCHELLNPNTSSDTKDQDNYKKAEKWCVVPVTVKNILESRKHSALSTDNSEKNKDEWTQKIKALKSKNVTIESLNLNTNKEEATAEEITRIKAKCSTIGNKKNHEDKYDENLDLFTKWCSIKKTI